MYLPDVELHDARTVDEATELLGRFAPNARILAGGTDLLVDLKAGRATVRHLISLNRLNDLREIRTEADGLCIGALVTPNRLAESPVVQKRFPALLDSLTELAATQVRNMATVGGNIASAVPSADLPPILICFGASVVLHAHGAQRSVPLESFFQGPRRTVMRTQEVLIGISIPYPPPAFGAAYARFALREANACAVAGVAAGLKLDRGGRVQAARVALAAVAPTPLLVEAAAAALVGRTPDEEAFEVAAEAAQRASSPISDIRGSSEFRRELVGVLTRRALSAALSRARRDNGD